MTNLSNGTRKYSSTAVSIAAAGHYRDFGIQTTTPSAQETLYTDEYFRKLEVIRAEANTDNVHFIGNKNGNTFYIGGGESNILTGGMGSDTFIFGSFTNASTSSTINGGGVITDFGIGVEMNKAGEAMAKSPTDDGETADSSGRVRMAYERNNPLTYAEGSDNLKINGKVVEIAFSGHNSVKSNANQTFSAYITYDEDGDTATSDDTHTILLANIVKAPNKTVYKTDDISARSLKIWDTRNGGDGYSLLSTNELNKLFKNFAQVEADGYAVASVRTALDNLMLDTAKELGLVDGSATSVGADVANLIATNYADTDNNNPSGGITP